MYWQEDTQTTGFKVDDEVVDLVFSLDCKGLPVDHNYALFAAISDVLPWVKEDHVAISHIHIPESANGWNRPEKEEGFLHLSRRTKLSVRAPKERVKDFDKILGVALNIQGHPLVLKRIVNEKLLSPSETLYSHFVVTETRDENTFMEQCAAEIEGAGVKIKKMLSGKVREVQYGDKALLTRSLMLADLTKDESILLQKKGLGEMQMMGCGIFIPYKGIKAVAEPDESA